MIKDSLGSAEIGDLIKPETMEISAWASWSYRLGPGGDKKTRTQNPCLFLYSINSFSTEVPQTALH